MGEYAEYMLNGDDCQYCGEFLGDGDGFPRSCASCESEMKPGADYDYKLDRPKDQKDGYARWQRDRQATIDVICSRIINEIGGKKMSKKSRKGISAAINEMLAGLLNVDDLVVIKRFEE